MATPIPFLSQQNNGIYNDCGPACVAMLAKWLSKPATISAIAGLIDPAQDGTTGWDIGKGLQSVGLTPVYGEQIYPHIQLVGYGALLVKAPGYETFTGLHWILRTSESTYHDSLFANALGASISASRAGLDGALRYVQSGPSKVGIKERPTTRFKVREDVKIRTDKSVDASTYTGLNLIKGTIVEGAVEGEWIRYGVGGKLVEVAQADQRKLVSMFNWFDPVDEPVVVTLPPPPIVVVPPAPVNDYIHAKYLLGINCLNFVEYAHQAAELGCRSFVVMGNNLGAVQLAQKYPDAIVTVRGYFNNKISPNQMIDLIGPTNLPNLIYMFANESDTYSMGSPDQMLEHFKFDEACANLVHQKAPLAKVALLTAAHGNPDITRPDIMDTWRKTYAAFLNANWQWAYGDMHSYTKGKRFPNHPPANAPIIDPFWFETRHTAFYNDANVALNLKGNLNNNVRWISTEIGVEAGAGGFNWAGYTDEQFKEWARWFVSAQRNTGHSFVSTGFFQASHRTDWGGYDARRYYGVLADMWKNDIPTTRSLIAGNMIYDSPPDSFLPLRKSFGNTM